jgi:hypothetical protein
MNELFTKNKEWDKSWDKSGTISSVKCVKDLEHNGWIVSYRYV